MEILEVLLASIASGLQIKSNSPKVENFNSGISGIASTTKSASAADVFSVDVEIREIALSASCWIILSFLTTLESEFSIAARPLSK